MVNVLKKGGTEMALQDIFHLQAVQEIVKKIQTLIYDESRDLQDLEEQMRHHVLSLGAVLMTEAMLIICARRSIRACGKPSIVTIETV
jgi:hypothetical protein